MDEKVFVDGEGRERKGIHAIFPICKQYEDKTIEILGTGFFVTRFGFFVTAKHVLADVFDHNMKQTEAIGIFQFIENNNYIIRPIIKAFSHNTSDIGVGVPAITTHNETGHPLPNPVMTLTLSSPQRGQEISTFSFPNSTVSKKEKVQKIVIAESWHHGQYEQFVPDAALETAKLKGPCYRVKMELPGATSGGPVAGPDGKIFGIVSSNFAGTDLSYVTRINEILPIKFQGIKLEFFDRDEFLIEDLVDLKHVSVD